MRIATCNVDGIGIPRDLGVLLEVFNGLPGGSPKPDNGGAGPE
jgi:hypothetical protein